MIIFRHGVNNNHLPKQACCQSEIRLLFDTSFWSVNQTWRWIRWQIKITYCCFVHLDATGWNGRKLARSSHHDIEYYMPRSLIANSHTTAWTKMSTLAPVNSDTMNVLHAWWLGWSMWIQLERWWQYGKTTHEHTLHWGSEDNGANKNFRFAETSIRGSTQHKSIFAFHVVSQSWTF